MRAILTIFPRPAQRELEAPKRSAETPEPSSASVPATAESVVVERLLAELDARGVTRAPAPYLMERPARNPHTRWFYTFLAVSWALSIALCVFVVKYLDRGNVPLASDPAQARSIHQLATNIGDQNQQFSRLINSMESLAGAVATSSMRTTAMQSVLRRMGHDVTQTQPAPQPPHPPSAASAVQILRQEPVAAGPSLGGHRHEPVEDVIAPHNAVVHHNENGVMDYWLLPRVVSGARTMIRVFPIAQTNIGIFVHCVDEVKDYVVTPSGDWLIASDSKGTP